MSADITNNGARDLFASYRQPAWHGLGNVFQSEVTEASEMLDLAGLSGWDIHEVEADLPGHRFITPTKHIVATIGAEDVVLGTTGERYTIVQNEDAFAFLQSLHDGARWETAGAIKGGRVVFGSMAFERDFVLDPSGVADKVESYLMVYTSHDGSTAIAGGITPIRVVCQNTLNVAMKDIRQTFKLRHSSSVETRMKTEAAMWRQANAYMDAFEAESKELFETYVSDRDFFSIVENLFPKPDEDSKAAVTRWERKQEVYAQAWNGRPNAGIQNTAWGVFNALTEANQWGRNIQNTDNGTENFYAAGAGFDIPTNQFRQTALEAARSFVDA